MVGLIVVVFHIMTFIGSTYFSATKKSCYPKLNFFLQSLTLKTSFELDPPPSCYTDYTFFTVVSSFFIFFTPHNRSSSVCSKSNVHHGKCPTWELNPRNLFRSPIHQPLGQLHSLITMLSGLLGIVGCAIYTMSTDDVIPEYYYGTGFALGWVSCWFFFLGGILFGASAGTVSTYDPHSSAWWLY